MRVLVHLLDAQAAGGQRVAAAVASELRQHGHRLTLVVPDRGPALDLFTPLGASTELLDLRSLRNAPSLPRLTKLVREHHVVYSHTSIPGEILAGIGAEVARRPHVIHRHTSPHLSPSQGVRALQTSLWRHVAGRATVIAVSNAVTRDIRGLMSKGVAIETIPNGVPDGLEPDPSPTNDPPRVGALGRLDPQKGMDVFVAARPLVRPSAADFAIGCSTGSFPAYEHEVLQAASDAGVAVVDAEGDGVGFLSQLDIVAIPSRWEGSPLTLFEAMALGKPIVASAISGIEEVLAPDAGILVPPEDPDALAGAIQRLVDDSPLRRKYADRALRVSASYRLSATGRRACRVVEAAAGIRSLQRED